MSISSKPISSAPISSPFIAGASVSNSVGSSYVEISLPSEVATQVVFQGTATEGAPMFFSTGKLSLFDGTNSGNFGVAVTPNTVHKCLTRWIGVLMSGITDGGALNSSVYDGNMGIGVTLGIGCNAAGANQLNGCGKNFKIWNRFITDIEAITTTR